MLGWLFPRLSRDETAVTENPAERRIFPYWDGSGWHRGDPLVIGRELEKACPKYADALQTLAARTGDLPPGPVRDDLKAQQDAAILELVKAARAAFRIRPLSNEGGLTEAETVAVLSDYLVFMGDLAEMARPH